MAETWKSVTFNEGAPFDPNDLNQLQTNLTNVFNTSKSLLNATKDNSGQNRVAIVDSDSIDIPLSGTANSPSAAVEVSFTSSFIAGQPIAFVATVGEPLTKALGVISVAAVADKASLKGKIYISSNTASKSTVTVNWMASQLKTL